MSPRKRPSIPTLFNNHEEPTLKKIETTSEHPWEEDPTIAYKNFLQYAGRGVNESVAYNRRILALLDSTNTTGDLQVHAHNGVFEPLATALYLPLYCSKITIRNIEDAELKFIFKETTIARILGIMTDSTQARQNLKIAYRNIVPSEFSEAKELAGPMGFNEYLIDGKNYKKNEEKCLISFFANSDFNATPIKIIIENCTGPCTIEGLDPSALARVFENKHNSHDFIVTPAPEPESPRMKP